MKRDIYRPLRIVHAGFDYRPEDSFEEKYRCVRRRIEALREKGFGGIVTNVAHEMYMRDEEELALMEEKARVCRELGMRMWLYDEDAYPSGGAGTLTLEANPDCQARACAMVRQVLEPGETLCMEMPRGHLRLLAAVCYTMKGQRPTDEELLTPYARCTTLPVCFVNDTRQNLLCLAFFEKYAYEGTHAENNVAYRRRYIDVSNPEAVRLFIENTYRPYSRHLSKYFARSIGDERENAVIEAIFTDEPSYMAVYINKGIACNEVVHEPDAEMALYPMVNWGHNVENRFASVYGYRLEEELTALFLGHGEHFCRVREDYYRLMSDLYEEAYFAQLSDYCASVGLNFSGHILLEDELPLHVMFEGNFFRLLRHMHIPGIDTLHSTPGNVWKQAFTPLLVRSISELYRDGLVMNEVSAHAQGGKVTAQQMYGALMLELALGANVFTSYYNDNDPNGEQKAVWEALNRANQAVSGKRLSDTLLLYPIETMMRYRKPDQHPIENDRGYAGFREHEDDCREKIRVCDAAMTGAQYAMLDAQHAFTYVDAGTAARQTEGGWKYFVIGACYVNDELAGAAARLAASGCRIVWYCPGDGAHFSKGLERLPPETVTARTPEELMAWVRPGRDLLTAQQGTTEGIVMLRTQDCALLVNRESKVRQLCWKGDVKCIIDARTGSEIELRHDSDGVNFTLGAWEAFLVYENRK